LGRALNLVENKKIVNKRGTECKKFANEDVLEQSKALQKTVFAEIFIFPSFGNRRFSKIRVGTSFSSFY